MIHDSIKVLRVQKKISQKEMALRLHKSPSSYNRMEQGRVKIEVEDIARIAKIFDCKVEDILADVQQENQLNQLKEEVGKVKEILNDMLQILQELKKTNMEMMGKLLHFTKNK